MVRAATTRPGAVEHHHGIFIDKGCTLFETLEEFDAARASVPVGGKCASVAAHVAHVTFYLEVLESDLRGRDPGPVDWKQIWSTVREVDTARWGELKVDLRRTYERVSGLLKAQKAWDEEHTWSCAVAIIAHTAYHLGAIRQALCAMK